MTERFLTVNGINLAGTDKRKGMIKTYSFTTDDDDAAAAAAAAAATTTITNSNQTTNHKKLPLMKSPSADSVSNDDDDDELPTSNKILRRRKLQKQIEPESVIMKKPPVISTSPWYKKIDLTNIFAFIGTLILIYLMWTKRDIWIPRLLLSSASTNARRPVITNNEQTIEEIIEPLTTTTSTTLIDNLPSDTTQKKTPTGNSAKDKIQQTGDKKSSTAPPSKSSSADSLQLKSRRNKLSFGQEYQKKLPINLQNRSINTDKPEESSLILPNQPSEDKPDQALAPKEHFQCRNPPNLNISLSNFDDIMEHVRKNFTSRRRDRQFISKLLTTTGFTKDKLYRYIYKKNDEFVSLRTFISLLDIFDLTIVITSK